MPLVEWGRRGGQQVVEEEEGEGGLLLLGAVGAREGGYHSRVAERWSLLNWLPRCWVQLPPALLVFCNKCRNLLCVNAAYTVACMYTNAQTECMYVSAQTIFMSNRPLMASCATAAACCNKCAIAGISSTPVHIIAAGSISASACRVLSIVVLASSICTTSTVPRGLFFHQRHSQAAQGKHSNLTHASMVAALNMQAVMLPCKTRARQWGGKPGGQERREVRTVHVGAPSLCQLVSSPSYLGYHGYAQPHHFSSQSAAATTTKGFTATVALQKHGS